MADRWLIGRGRLQGCNPDQRHNRHRKVRPAGVALASLLQPEQFLTFPFFPVMKSLLQKVFKTIGHEFKILKSFSFHNSQTSNSIGCSDLMPDALVQSRRPPQGWATASPGQSRGKVEQLVPQTLDMRLEPKTTSGSGCSIDVDPTLGSVLVVQSLPDDHTKPHTSRTIPADNVVQRPRFLLAVRPKLPCQGAQTPRLPKEPQPRMPHPVAPLFAPQGLGCKLVRPSRDGSAKPKQSGLGQIARRHWPSGGGITAVASPSPSRDEMSRIPIHKA